jgi:hypothetical protein
MDLDRAEQVALAMLQSQPTEVQKMAVNGNIQLNDLHAYFHRLSFLLDASWKKRHNEIVDVESASTD